MNGENKYQPLLLKTIILNAKRLLPVRLTILDG